MWHKRIRQSTLAIALWTTCLGEPFDVGLVSYANDKGSDKSGKSKKGKSYAHLLYPALLDEDSPLSTTRVNIEYLFNEISISGYDLSVGAVVNAPVAPGKYPIVAYLHGSGGFSLDSHTLLTQLAAMGFVVVTADMPGYLVGDTVYASDLQRHMGNLLASIFHTCPPGAEAVCGAMDTEHISVIGPGVVDPMCTLDGWTKQGVRPTAQVFLDGDIEVDTSCHPVELDTQDFSIIAVGMRDLDSEFTSEVEKLMDRTMKDKGMSAYFLALPKIASVPAFTDLCEMSHTFKALKHLSGGTRSCDEINANDLEDAQSIIRVITSNILFHHFWGHTLTAPSDSFNPEDYPSYLYRSIGEGLIVDAVGKLNHLPSVVPIPLNDPTGGYHFRTPTVLSVFPLFLISALYFTCSIGLCVSDYRTAKRSPERANSGFCFDFKKVIAGKKSSARHSFRQPGSELNGPKSLSSSPASRAETTATTPKTVVTNSTSDFLTGRKRSRTPSSRLPHNGPNEVELTIIPSKPNPATQPLLHKQPTVPEVRKKRTLRMKHPRRQRRRTRKSAQPAKAKRERRLSKQEIYEVLGSGPDTEEEVRPVTNSELNKLLKM